jgi:hypothetical protein
LWTFYFDDRPGTIIQAWHEITAAGDQPMIDIPTIDELRETRRRLAEESGLDVQRYAASLQQAAPSAAGSYVSTPLLPQPMSPFHQSRDLEPERAGA